MSKRDYCGPRFEYNVAYDSLEGGKKEWIEKFTTDVTYDIDIDGAEHTILVLVRNGKGPHPLKHSIFVPSSRKITFSLSGNLSFKLIFFL